MNIQLLLDSAILDEARQAAGWGWVSGATTNPTLLAKSALSPAETLREISRLLKGQIFYQLTGATIEAMKEEAKLADEILGSQLVLKIPATTLGFQASAALSGKYTIAITSLYTVAQALAANAGALRALLSQPRQTSAAGWCRPGSEIGSCSGRHRHPGGGCQPEIGR